MKINSKLIRPENASMLKQSSSVTIFLEKASDPKNDRRKQLAIDKFSFGSSKEGYTSILEQRRFISLFYKRFCSNFYKLNLTILFIKKSLIENFYVTLEFLFFTKSLTDLIFVTKHLYKNSDFQGFFCWCFHIFGLFIGYKWFVQCYD